MPDQESIEKEGLEHLENIEQELKEIKSRTGGRWNSWRNGIYQGMGAIVGSIAGLILIGFLLSLFGGIPGLSQAKDYLQQAVDRAPRR